ncbi:MAG: hypothetical protein ACPGU7_02260 [Gammaproteobacteria bacterium]
MDTSNQYFVAIKGGLRPGGSRERAMALITGRLKLSEARAQRILDAVKPVVIKKNVDAATAKRVCAALRKADLNAVVSRMPAKTNADADAEGACPEHAGAVHAPRADAEAGPGVQTEPPIRVERSTVAQPNDGSGAESDRGPAVDESTGVPQGFLHSLGRPALAIGLLPALLIVGLSLLMHEPSALWLRFVVGAAAAGAMIAVASIIAWPSHFKQRPARVVRQAFFTGLGILFIIELLLLTQFVDKALLPEGAVRDAVAGVAEGGRSVLGTVAKEPETYLEEIVRSGHWDASIIETERLMAAYGGSRGAVFEALRAVRAEEEKMVEAFNDLLVDVFETEAVMPTQWQTEWEAELAVKHVARVRDATERLITLVDRSDRARRLFEARGLAGPFADKALLAWEEENARFVSRFRPILISFREAMDSLSAMVGHMARHMGVWKLEVDGSLYFHERDVRREYMHHALAYNKAMNAMIERNLHYSDWVAGRVTE